MIRIRQFEPADVPTLEKAIAKNTFHPGEWKTEHFHNPNPDPEKYNPPVSSHVIEGSHGPLVFVRFTKTLRISCVWNDETDNSHNAQAIIFGIRAAVQRARASGFSEIIITTSHPKLATFLQQIMKMTKSGDEFILAV